MNTIVTSVADAEIANHAVEIFDIAGSDVHARLVSAFMNIATADPRIVEKLTLGGTLRKRELDTISERNKNLWPAILGVQTWLSDSTGLDFTRQGSVKIFGPRKPGMAAHRDSDQADSYDSVNAIASITGNRENGLWVIPRLFKPDVEPGRVEPRYEPALANSMHGTIDGTEFSVSPFRRIQSELGSILLTDERAGTGTWLSDTLGDVVLKHSSKPIGPAVSLVCRAYTPSSR